LASTPTSPPVPKAFPNLRGGKVGKTRGRFPPPSDLARARHAGIAGLDPENLAKDADEWLAPLLVGRRDLDVPKGKLIEALLGRLSWDERQRLDKAAPREFVTPAGTHHLIDYAGADAPSAEVRVQALRSEAHTSEL